MPTPAALGFERPAAERELEELGWYQAEHIDLLRDMSGAADPDQVLLGLLRFKDAVAEEEWQLFNHSLHINPELRLRVFGLLGASTVLGDHLIAHPELWQEIGKPAPTPGEMMHFMLSAVDARPDCAVQGCGASENLDTPGMYRSALQGRDTIRTIKHAYRTLLMRIAAVDLAGTFLVRSNSGAVAIPLTYSHVTSMLSTLADAALTATLACAQGTVWGEDPADARLAVIALGKCGARELNYISDVDVVFVGPYDLSSSLGHVGEIDHPEVVECIKGIIAKANAKGVKLGCFADTVEGGMKWRDLGVKFIGYSCDTYLFMQAAKADVDAFAQKITMS